MIFPAPSSRAFRCYPDTLSRINFRASFGIVACASFFASCAPNSRSAKPGETVFRSFDPPKGKALVCIYRPSWPFTGLIKRPVYIDKQHVASTGSGSFIAVPLNPGNHSVQAAALWFVDTPQYHKEFPDIKLRLAAGQTVFIRQTTHSAATSQSSTMIIQTGSVPIPISIGGPVPLGATVEEPATGRSECSGLKQIYVPESAAP